MIFLGFEKILLIHSIFRMDHFYEVIVVSMIFVLIRKFFQINIFDRFFLSSILFYVIDMHLISIFQSINIDGFLSSPIRPEEWPG